jgi:hypothetical protein
MDTRRPENERRAPEQWRDAPLAVPGPMRAASCEYEEGAGSCRAAGLRRGAVLGTAAETASPTQQQSSRIFSCAHPQPCSRQDGSAAEDTERGVVSRIGSVGCSPRWTRAQTQSAIQGSSANPRSRFTPTV